MPCHAMPYRILHYVHYITFHYLTLHITLHYVTYFTLHNIILHHTTLQYISTTLQYISSHHIAWHHITSHYIQTCTQGHTGSFSRRNPRWSQIKISVRLQCLFQAKSREFLQLHRLHPKDLPQHKQCCLRSRRSKYKSKAERVIKSKKQVRQKYLNLNVHCLV